MSKKCNMQAIIVCIILILGGAIMAYGFKNDKCKVEIYSKEEVDKKMREIKTQSLTYVNEDTGANILVTFKRTGNIVECFCNAYIPANAQHTFATSDFTGSVPVWAYPDESFGKSQLNYNGTIDGYLLILLHKDGNISGLYQNLSTEYDRTILNQFTYIVDDSDTEYQLGDIDGNGTIDEVDLEILKMYLADKISLTDKQLKVADINKDNTTDSSDMLKLQKYILGQIESLE